jgi:RNA polymerase sigma-70 factor (ECF subfamily)
MHTTPVSLLDQLRRPEASQAWERFVRLYTPLLWHWARRIGLQDQDAADLVQDVLVQLVRKLPAFRYEPGRSFRGWMRMVLLNKWRDRPRRPAMAELETAIDVVEPSDGDALEEREYRLYVVGRALKLMADHFEPATWRAYRETVMHGRPAAEVAAELGMTLNALYLAKSRVLARLRQELNGLLD